MKARNPLGCPGDYPYEVPVWNLSPITFQAGSFVFPQGWLHPPGPAPALLPAPWRFRRGWLPEGKVRAAFRMY
ncbi:hypothetical protein NicSoilC5_33540 [Arthrobacter sp. NicSoilC5]|nr:hypothetical protein NicSoilC5_33540 [Arthrobacter sp. NicSoilC5]